MNRVSILQISRQVHRATVALAAAIVALTPIVAAGQGLQALINRAPAVAVTQHTGTFGGQTVSYTAIVEEHILKGPDSVANASLVTISYVRDGIADRSRRPVMFVFNGGPGASSSPLHMNGLGPRCRTADGIGENPDCILDVTDLVFIDPVGTGFSRPYTTEAGKKFYWSRSGDAASVKQVIDMWLHKYGRQSSPRYIAGESYGTTRIGLIFRNHKDVRFDGVLLVAVVGDRVNAGHEMPFVTTLPTMATSAWYHVKSLRNGRTVEEVFTDAVRFARTDYLMALVQGASLPAAEKARIAQKMSTLIGLPADFIVEKNLRLSEDDWMLNVMREQNLRTGMLDTRVTAPRDTARSGGLSDPALGGGTLRIGTAMLAPAIVPGTEPKRDSSTNPPTRPSALEIYLKRDLQFQTLESYRALNLDINGVWNHEGMAETNSAIATAMNVNPTMRLFWTGGYFDLTTPICDVQYSFDQVAMPPDRTTSALLPGGHSVFADEVNRQHLAAQLRQWIR